MRIKPLQDLLAEASHGGGFKRTLGRFNLLTLGIGAIIGAGIFALTGQAAAQYAGPAIIISFVVSGIACALAGLCYAEFAAAIPISGSAYTFAYATMGEFTAWFIGWNLILEYLVSASTVAVSWSGYLLNFLKDFGIYLPAQWCHSTGTKLYEIPGQGWQPATDAIKESLLASGISLDSLPQMTAIFNAPAVFIIAILTVILLGGVQESAKFNNIMVVIKVSIILIFIAMGIQFIKMENLTPFIPQNTGNFGEFGWTGIFRAAGVIFFAYIGFDAVSTAAQESKNPQRDMPFGILGSLFICTILYMLVALVLTGVVSYKELNVASPIAVGMDAMPGVEWLKPWIKVAALAGLSSVILVMLLGQPRIFFAMAKDGLLPPAFAKVSKTNSPYVSTIITGVFAALLAGVLPLDVLGELVSIGTLLAFIIVCIGVPVMRKQRPDLERPFKTPFSPVVPILGVLACLAQMVFLPAATWIRLLLWLAVGTAIYYAYGYKNSLMNPANRKKQA